MNLTATIIKQRRQELGKSQVSVAVACGVSLSAYRMWEAGCNKPIPEHKERLIKTLGLGGAEHGEKSSHTAK